MHLRVGTHIPHTDLAVDRKTDQDVRVRVVRELSKQAAVALERLKVVPRLDVPDRHVALVRAGRAHLTPGDIDQHERRDALLVRVDRAHVAAVPRVGEHELLARLAVATHRRRYGCLGPVELGHQDVRVEGSGDEGAKAGLVHELGHPIAVEREGEDQRRREVLDRDRPSDHLRLEPIVFEHQRQRLRVKDRDGPRVGADREAVGVVGDMDPGGEGDGHVLELHLPVHRPARRARVVVELVEGDHAVARRDDQLCKRARQQHHGLDADVGALRYGNGELVLKIAAAPHAQRAVRAGTHVGAHLGRVHCHRRRVTVRLPGRGFRGLDAEVLRIHELGGGDVAVLRHDESEQFVP